MGKWNNYYMNRLMRQFSRKKNIVSLLLLGWMLPVIVMTVMLATFVEVRTTDQVSDTVSSSLNKATEVFDLELFLCETASKNASYYSNIREAYVSNILYSQNIVFSDAVNGFLRSEYKYNDSVTAAVLYFPQMKRTFYTVNNSAAGSYKNIEYYNNQVKGTVIDLSKSLGTGTTIISSGGHCYMVRNLMLSNFEPYAILALEINQKSLLESFESVWGYSNCAVLLDDKLMMGSQSVYNSATDLGLNKDFVKKRNFSYSSVKFEEYGKEITAIVELDNDLIYQRVYSIWFFFIGILMLIIPAMVLGFYLFRKNVTAKEEIALRDAKIMALQSQINPHFLNNTFEIINWEARLNGNIKVSKMIEALSTMMEATMNRRGNHMNTLREEISYVDAYAYIISERLGDKFVYQKEIDEALLGFEVPKLIVQPIVENAVEHGIRQVQKGNIVLSVTKEGSCIYIKVRNDGPLSEENKAKIYHILNENVDYEKEPSLSLGIRNVNNRLKLIYGEESGLSIESIGDEYTLSTIVIKDKNDLNNK